MKKLFCVSYILYYIRTKCEKRRYKLVISITVNESLMIHESL